MTVSWVFLTVSVVGLLFTAAALRPLRFPNPLTIPGFFAGWLANELVFHHFAWQVLATIGFVLAGALETWPGWVALGVVLLQWLGNLVIVRDVRRTPACLQAALEAGLDNVPSRDDQAAVAGILNPFRFRHPEVARTKDVVFGRAGGRDLHLDVYRHRDHDVDDRRPVLLYLHGGAWTISNKDEQGFPLMLTMARRGWIGVNANYRLSPFARFPEHLVDAKRAVAWIRMHADEIGADPSFVAVAGGSAGGHLAALVGLTGGRPELQPGFEAADTNVQACVPIYGVYDFLNRDGAQLDEAMRFYERWVMHATPEDDPELFRLASPLDQVHADAPPTFVIHGAKDTIAPPTTARAFADLLRQQGVTTVHAELPGAQHAFDVFASHRTVHTLDAIDRFLRAAHATSDTLSGVG